MAGIRTKHNDLYEELREMQVNDLLVWTDERVTVNAVKTSVRYLCTTLRPMVVKTFEYKDKTYIVRVE